jgi:hypothetical protein
LAVPFTAGQRVLASDLNTATQQAAWTSYTPTWTSTGTAPVLGNGTLVGYYAKVGRLVTVKISLSSGSSTTFGTGNYIFSLPLSAAVTGLATGALAHAGAWGLYNASNATFYIATAAIQQGTPGQVIGLVNASANFLGATNPTTFSTAGCQLTCTITYESTS